MSGDEGTTATNAANTASVGSAQTQQMSPLPSGTVPMPKPLNREKEPGLITPSCEAPAVRRRI